jgi:hypothetical protein
LPSGVSLLVTKNNLILNDNGGRSLHFNTLAVGEAHFSRSESLWLVRGGLLERDKNHPLAMLWHTLPESWRLNSHLYLCTADALARGGYSVFQKTKATPHSLPPYQRGAFCAACVTVLGKSYSTFTPVPTYLPASSPRSRTA